MTKVQRYKVGYYTDEWGMSSNTPCLIPADSGYAVKFEDYLKLETELAALKAENESLKLDAARLDFILRKQLIVIQDCDDKYFTYNAQSGKRGPEMDSEAEAIDAAIVKGEQK